MDLEKADGKGQVDLEACHRSYSIDLGKMEQTNLSTDVKRKVERAKSSKIKYNVSDSPWTDIVCILVPYSYDSTYM